MPVRFNGGEKTDPNICNVEIGFFCNIAESECTKYPTDTHYIPVTNSTCEAEGYERIQDGPTCNKAADYVNGRGHSWGVLGDAHIFTENCDEEKAKYPNPESSFSRFNGCTNAHYSDPTHKWYKERDDKDKYRSGTDKDGPKPNEPSGCWGRRTKTGIYMYLNAWDTPNNCDSGSSEACLCAFRGPTCTHTDGATPNEEACVCRDTACTTQTGLVCNPLTQNKTLIDGGPMYGLCSHEYQKRHTWGLPNFSGSIFAFGKK